MISRSQKFVAGTAFALVLAFGVFPATRAVLSAQAVPPLTQVLPVDPDVTTGKFDNGLKYMIRKNALPAVVLPP